MYKYWALSIYHSEVNIIDSFSLVLPVYQITKYSLKTFVESKTMFSKVF